MIPAETVIFATQDSPDGQADARAWCKAHGMTADDARLVKRDDQCLVIAKRLVNLRVLL